MNFFNPPFDIYTIATGFVLGLSLVEICLFLLGASLSKLFHADSDYLHHDFDIDTVNLFNIGKVPFFLVLICMAGFFGFSGIGIHLLLAKWGMTLSNFYVLPLSILSSALLTFSVTSKWSKWFPNEETYAVSEKVFIGSVGVVEMGSGHDKSAVEIATYDQHGVKHFIMAYTALPGVEVHQGQKVIIVGKKEYFLVLPLLEKEQDM